MYNRTSPMEESTNSKEFLVSVAEMFDIIAEY
jgi:hypothetical protein